MIDVIVNPIAGSGYAKQVSKKLISILEANNIPYRHFYTKFKGHGKEIATESVQNGTDLVLSVGGDGTTYEVIAGLVNTKTSLGIIPAGTGNDFVRAINMPKDPIESLKKILSSTAKSIDIGMLNGRPFLNVCGTGIDVSVLEYASRYSKYIKGNLSYIAGLAMAVAKHKSSLMKIKIDDSIELNQKFVICSIANGKFFGGGIPIASRALVDDSYFDVIMLKNVSRLAIPYYLLELLKGRILRHDLVNYYRAKKIEIDCESSMKFEADGEICEIKKAVIELLPKSINVVY